MYKRYQAVVHGQLEGHGMIDAPLKERHAVTYYRAVNSVTHEDGQVVTVVDLWPKTGVGMMMMASYDGHHPMSTSGLAHTPRCP